MQAVMFDITATYGGQSFLLFVMWMLCGILLAVLIYHTILLPGGEGGRRLDEGEGAVKSYHCRTMPYFLIRARSVLALSPRSSAAPFLPSMRQDLRASDAPIRELSMSDQTQFQRSFADGQNQQQQQNAESSNRRARADEPRFAIDGARSDTVTTPRSAPLGGRVSLSEVNALA